MYQRTLKTQINKWITDHKVIILYGARQVGKTTLAKEIATELDPSYLYCDCESMEIQNVLNSRSIETIKLLLRETKTVIFDEAQKVQYIGVALKLIHDHLPEIKVIATGSSSFELANKVSEPLTGRNLKFHLYPLSLGELSEQENVFALTAKLGNFMRFGLYPEVVNLPEEKATRYLKTISSDYLYKDALELGWIQKPIIYKNLLRNLAFLVSKETTINELAGKIGADRETIERYLDLLQKTFVIYVLRPLHRQHHKEVVYPFKVYFYDLGIRNAIIEDFRPIESRDSNEIGSLWENLCIIERLKKNEYAGESKLSYFWRTRDNNPKEYDLVEEHNGQMQVFEIKTSGTKEHTVKTYPSFFEAYPESTLQVIHKQNWWEWLV
jgi:uncharacterized protein